MNSLQPLSMDQVLRLVNDRESAREAEAKKSLKSVGKIEKLKNGEVDCFLVCPASLPSY